MTYPPQQPGPYGPDPYGQQPGYGQAPWASQGAYPVGPPPPKPRTGLIATLIIVGILALGGGGVGLYFLTKDDGGGPGSGPANPNDAQAVAEKFADVVERAINTDLQDLDLAEMRAIVCGKDFSVLEEETKEELDRRRTSTRKPTRAPESERYDISVSDVRVDGNQGSFVLTEHRDGKPSRNRDPYDLTREDGAWKVCGLYKNREQPSRSQSPPSSKRKPGSTFSLPVPSR